MLSSSQDMTSRLVTSSRASSESELGRTPFSHRGQTCFELTTHLCGLSSLRHFLMGLREIETNYAEAQLVLVNGIDVRAWSHTEVATYLHDKLTIVTDNELKLTVRAKDAEGRKHIVEIIINAIYEDGFGDTVHAALEIVVRATDKIISTPDVTEVHFRSSNYVRIRHGALTGFFLREGQDHALCMDIPPSDSEEYVFKCYNFIGHNQEREGGGGDEYPRLCVLQQPRSDRFVAVCPTSGRLRTDMDSGFRTDIQSITTPDCHFFIVYVSGDGSDTFCLQPLVMRKYYLRYDAVKGLKLQKCKKPPYKDFAAIRFFSFRFVPVDTLATTDE